MFAAIGACGEMLAAILDPANRVAATHREPAQADVFGQQYPLVAKPAADIRRDDSNLDLLDPQALGKAVAYDVRLLVAGMKHKLLHPVVPSGDRSAAFHRRHALARRGDFARDLDRRVERRFHVDVDERLEKDIVAPVLMKQRRTRLPRLQHVVDSRQFLEIDFDGRGDIFGFGPRIGDAHRNQFTDLPDLLNGQDRLVRCLEPRQPRHCADRLDAFKVGGRENGILVLRRDLYPSNTGMGERTANERHIAQPGETDIADELPAPAQVPIIFLAKQTCANSLAGHAEFPSNARLLNSSYF